MKEREIKFQEQFAEYKTKNDANFNAVLDEVKAKYEAEIKDLNMKLDGKEPTKEEKVLQEKQPEKVDS